MVSEDLLGIRIDENTSKKTGEEIVPLRTIEGVDHHTGREENRDSRLTEDIARAEGMAIDHSMENAAIAIGDPDRVDVRTRTGNRPGIETDTPKVRGGKALEKDLEAPTPTTTGEGITAGTIGTGGTHAATLGKEIGPRTRGMGNNHTTTAAQAGDTDSSLQVIGGACPQESTSSRST